MSIATVLAKKVVNGLLQLVGLKVTRVSARKPLAAKYFNTGNLSPHQENSVTLYDTFYGDTSAVEDYYGPARVAFYKGVIDHVKAQQITLDGKDVADVGCGVGYLLSEVQRRYECKSLSGFDFSAQAIEYSRKKFPGATFKVHDIYDSVGESFDVIFCTEVLEHLEFPHRALARLVTALRPEGQLILTVPNGRVDTLTEHINFWSPESWKAFLERERSSLDLRTSTLFDSTVNFAVLTKAVAPTP
ncbi:MAG: class I SAM-dependent methyltransferase [Rhizobacter sp.]|nr:class I SAM-dependent methyltransferase [Rhizobacter sp.]